MATPDPRAYAAEVAAVGLDAGLVAVGTTRAQPWTSTRGRLVAHRRDGLGSSMEFTLRNPARSTEPHRLLRDCRWLVVAAWGYAQTVPDRPGGPAGRVSRYATADHYARLEGALETMAVRLRADGHRAAVYSDDNGLVDREAAWRAGVGWYGRNSNVLVPGVGSWVVLGAVATDAPLAQLSPPRPDGCGSCRRCIDACPTSAIVAPGVVDARRCLAWVVQAPGSIPVELRSAVGDRLYGCDDCQEVCPPNRRHEVGLAVRGELAAETAPGAWIDPVEWLSLDDDELLRRADRWYVPDRDPDLLRRNLLVVLGNGPATTTALAAVGRYLDHDRPLLREHAEWADRSLRARSHGST